VRSGSVFGRKGGFLYSEGTPSGYFTGRTGDLAIDVLTGELYRCTSGNTWTKIL
jgi:hypothetical protein